MIIQYADSYADTADGKSFLALFNTVNLILRSPKQRQLVLQGGMLRISVPTGAVNSGQIFCPKFNIEPEMGIDFRPAFFTKSTLFSLFCDKIL